MHGDQFDVILSSNASPDIHPNNKLNSFAVELHTPLSLNGNYIVALENISFPRNWCNVTEHNFFNVGEMTKSKDVSGKDKKSYHEKTVSLTPGYYTKPTDLAAEFVKKIGTHSIALNYDEIRNQMDVKVAHEIDVTETTKAKYTRVTDVLGIPNSIETFYGTPHFVQVKENSANVILDRKVTRRKGRYYSYLQTDMNLGCSHLIVLLDIVRDGAFADCQMPIIAAVPITEPRDLQMHTYSPSSLSYKNVVRHHVTSMKITILNDFLAPFPFGDTGRVFVSLKFKRINTTQQ